MKVKDLIAILQQETNQDINVLAGFYNDAGDYADGHVEVVVRVTGPGKMIILRAKDYPEEPPYVLI